MNKIRINKFSGAIETSCRNNVLLGCFLKVSLMILKHSILTTEDYFVIDTPICTKWESEKVRMHGSEYNVKFEFISGSCSFLLRLF